jgi:PAS domain S-box-containing protein
MAEIHPEAAVQRQMCDILLRQTQEAVIVCDLAGTITVWNESATRVLGWAADEMIGRNALERMSEAQRADAAERIGAVLAGTPYSGVYQDTHKDGRAVWLEVQVTLVRDDAGRPLGVMGVARDITARKLAEQREWIEREVVRHVRDGIIVTDANVLAPPGPRIVYVNPALARSTGYAQDELLGRTPRVFQGPRTDRAALARIRAALARAEPVHEVLINYRKDGSTFYTELDITPLRDGTGAVSHFVSVQRDITDQVRIEDELSRSEAILRANEALGRIGGWELDVASSRVAWTGEVHHIHEVPIGTELTLDDVVGLYARESRSRLRQLLRRAIEDQEPFDLELQRTTERGHSRWVHMFCRPGVREGQVVRLAGTIQDITERKRAESALHASEERLRLALDGCHIGSFDWDMIADRVVWSRLHYELFGFHEDEPNELRYQHFVERIHPEDVAELERRPGDAIELRTEYHFEVRIVWPDGTVRWIYGTGRCLYDEDGRPYRMVGLVADISDRKRAEALRQTLEEQLRQSQKMEALGQLAGGVIHDFNNILTVISGIAELLSLELPPDAPQRELVAEIQATGERGVGMTRQLLAFSRRQVVHDEVFRLNEPIAQMARMLDRLLGASIRLDTQLCDELWPVRADKGQFEQVIMNLVVNARDAMPAGGRLLISTSNVELEADGPAGGARPYVRLAVADTGSGMTEAVQARLFEPFFTTKEKGKGTGLGMSTVSRIVQRAQGRITVKSAVGHGTTVYVDLPRADVELRTGVELAYEGPSRRSETVMLVEDDALLRPMTARVLQEAGYRVIAVASGMEALAAHEAHGAAISLVLTDVMMPGMNGRELAWRLQTRDARLRIAFLSGLLEAGPSGDDGERAFAQFAKPYRADELVQFVRRLLAR